MALRARGGPDGAGLSDGPGGFCWRGCRSVLGGRAPARIMDDTSIQDVDPNAPNDATAFLRTGSGVPDVAIDPLTSELYLAVEGTALMAGQADQVELIHSVDGDKTWSAPTRISCGRKAPSYTPSFAVDWRSLVRMPEPPGWVCSRAVGS